MKLIKIIRTSVDIIEVILKSKFSSASKIFIMILYQEWQNGGMFYFYKKSFVHKRIAFVVTSGIGSIV